MKKFIYALAFLALSLPVAASASTVRPGYQMYNQNITWNTNGPSLPVLNISGAARQQLIHNSETIVGSVLPLFPTNPNIVFISTVSAPDNGLRSFKIYTYHILKGTLRLYLEETGRADAGAAYSYEPIGVDGSKLVLRRIDSAPAATLPCNPTIDWYLYSYRYNLVDVNTLSKKPRFETYALPRDIFTRGQQVQMACAAVDYTDANQPPNYHVGNNLQVGVDFTADGIPSIAGCQVYPNNSVWNKDISAANVRAESQNYVTEIGAEKKLNVGFGSDAATGIPYNVIGQNTNWGDVRLMSGKQFSNPGPYPIPNEPLIEAGAARRMIVLDNTSCYYYEFLNARRDGNANVWIADLISVFYMKADWLRPQKWPAATASGIQLLPGLLKYDEVAADSVHHPLLFTAPSIQTKFIEPATAGGKTDNGKLPAFGAHFRLKSDYDTSRLPYQARVIAEALKKYGMIVADYGTPWTLMGTPDPRWNDKELQVLNKIPGSAFEVIDSGPFVHLWVE